MEDELAAILSRSPLPTALSLQAGVLRLQPSEERIAHRILLQVPISELVRGDGRVDGTAPAECAFFARLLDAQGATRAKFSRLVSRPSVAAPSEDGQPGSLWLAHDVQLGPGSYTLEAAAEDRATGRSAARKVTFSVPAPPNGVSLSSLVLLGRTEAVPTGRLNPSDSLQFHGKRIVPNLGGRVTKHKGGEVRLYLVVYPEAGVPYDPQLGIEFSRGGKIVGASQPKLPDPDAQGRISFIIEFSTDLFQPGEYVARAVVRQGNAVADARVPFHVVTESRK